MSLKKETADALAQQRRKEILHAAMVLFDERGYANTSVAQIAEKASISKGLIYHYFHSKLDILKATSEIITEAAAYLWAQKTLRDAIYVNLYRLCTPSGESNFYPPVRVMYAAAISGSISPEDFADSENDHIFTSHLGAKIFTKCVTDAQERGEIGPGEPEQIAEFIWSHSLGVMIRVFYTKNRIDLIRETEFLMELLS